MKNFIKRIYNILSVTVITMMSLLLIVMVFTIILSFAGAFFLINTLGPVTEVSLPDPEKQNSSYIYSIDKQSDEYTLIYKVTPDTGNICLQTDGEFLPDYVKAAFVCIEDERFYSHDGVDIKSTTAAIAGEFLRSTGIMPSEMRGGSTITQQLVKNITKDDEITPHRKLREIIRSVNLEQKYTKDQILEKYLNIIYFGQTPDGYNLYGIQSAAQAYFGTDASTLSVAQAAELAAIPQNPSKFSLFSEKNENNIRAEYCLRKMFESGIISPDKYSSSLYEIKTNSAATGRLTGNELNKHSDDFVNSEPTSWIIDTALSEFCDFLCESENINRSDAMKKFMNGGYELYLTADSDIQSVLDEKYSDYTYFPEESAFYTDISGQIKDEQIQSAFVVMNYSGEILGITGRIGEKKESFCWNNAIDAHRQPGSTIKPLTTYGYALENDLVTWSSYFYDTPLIPASSDTQAWPQNYSYTYSDNKMTVNDFLTNSYNTLPALLCSEYGVENIFRFATETMKLSLDKDTDMTLAALSLGATGTGPSLLNITNSYIPYGNGGLYYKAHIINRIKDACSEHVYLENSSKDGRQTVSQETAYIINRLLRNVIVCGTGRNAQLFGKDIVGKTGTTENYRDVLFVGLTPDFISSIWIGYENGNNPDAIKAISSAQTWKNIFGDYADTYQSEKEFPVSENVIYTDYCSESGLIASDNCPKGGKGFYKTTCCKKCDINHHNDT